MKTVRSRISLTIILAGAIAAVACATVGCGGSAQFDPYIPIFTNPDAKLAETANADFAAQLLDDAVSYEPLLLQAGTVVHLGFWSGPGNHGSLVRLLDSINAIRCKSTEAQPECAVWDEGAQTSLQYPSYVEMTQEHWYDRGNAAGGQVTIYGATYTDPFPVTFEQADEIWGRYSQRYADMATTFTQATGMTSKAWCFVEGAKANRIFYMYELPELAAIEAAGGVAVYFAKTQDADWQNPDDWIEGTANAPAPIAADVTLPEDIEHPSQPDL
jgi:hypothetical protein